MDTVHSHAAIKTGQKSAHIFPLPHDFNGTGLLKPVIRKDLFMKSLYSGNLRRDYARFCFPCIANLIVFSIYSIVDCLFVSHYVSADALAAVTLSHPYLSVLFSIGITLAVGAGTLIAEALGEKDQKKADFIFSENLIVTIILGVIICIPVLIFLKPISLFFGADSSTLKYTSDYIGSIAPFSVFFIMEYNLEFLVKTDGNPTLSLFTVIGTSLLNIFLDWLFVAVWGMETFGAGLATGISQAVATVIFLSYILFSKNGLFHFHRFKWDLSLYKKLIPLGFADGSMEILSAIMVLIYNNLLEHNIGTQGVAAFGVIIYIFNLVFNMSTGVTQGMEPLVSYHLGAEKPGNCRRLYRYALTLQLILGTAVFFVCEIFTLKIVGIFFQPHETEAIALAVYGLRRYACCFILLGFNLLTSGYMTSLCRPAPALTISMCRAFFVHVTVLLAMFLLFGINSIWWSVVISESIVAVISIILLKNNQPQL